MVIYNIGHHGNVFEFDYFYYKNWKYSLLNKKNTGIVTGVFRNCKANLSKTLLNIYIVIGEDLSKQITSN